MKRQAQFTPHQLATWMATLSTFPVPVVTRACLTMGHGTDPFPDLGKIMAECRRIEFENDLKPVTPSYEVPTRGAYAGDLT